MLFVPLCLRSNPGLSGRLREAGRNFEIDRQQFLNPLCKQLYCHSLLIVSCKRQPLTPWNCVQSPPPPPSLLLLLPPPSPSFLLLPPSLLLPVVEHSQLRQAAELGEKYEDFRVLVQLCERTGNREQLREYMARFSAQVPIHAYHASVSASSSLTRGSPHTASNVHKCATNRLG